MNKITKLPTQTQDNYSWLTPKVLDIVFEKRPSRLPDGTPTVTIRPRTKTEIKELIEREGNIK